MDEVVILLLMVFQIQNVAEVQIDGIMELRKFDVPYHIRVCFDLKINVELWSVFFITIKSLK